MSETTRHFCKVKNPQSLACCLENVMGFFLKEQTEMWALEKGEALCLAVGKGVCSLTIFAVCSEGCGTHLLMALHSRSPSWLDEGDHMGYWVHTCIDRMQGKSSALCTVSLGPGYPSRDPFNNPRVMFRAPCWRMRPLASTAVDLGGLLVRGFQGHQPPK